jgi:NAD(P)-dependent dehydrogenase (short-subunit alcohol dehydrogenase family)
LVRSIPPSSIFQRPPGCTSLASFVRSPRVRRHGSAAALAALTKGGLNAITRSLTIEYASRHVRVNAVSPGAIKTPMHSPQAHDFLSGLQPMGRMGEMQEVTDAVNREEAATPLLRRPAKACVLLPSFTATAGSSMAGCVESPQ